MDEQIAAPCFTYPRAEGWEGERFGDVTGNIGMEEIPHHRARIKRTPDHQRGANQLGATQCCQDDNFYFLFLGRTDIVRISLRPMCCLSERAGLICPSCPERQLSRRSREGPQRNDLLVSIVRPRSSGSDDSDETVSAITAPGKSLSKAISCSAHPRHSNLHVTNKYLQATSKSKRSAQEKLEEAILPGFRHV